MNSNTERDRNDIKAKAFGTIPNGSVVLLKKFDRSGDWANIITYFFSDVQRVKNTTMIIKRIFDEYLEKHINEDLKECFNLYKKIQCNILHHLFICHANGLKENKDIKELRSSIDDAKYFYYIDENRYDYNEVVMLFFNCMKESLKHNKYVCDVVIRWFSLDLFEQVFEEADFIYDYSMILDETEVSNFFMQNLKFLNDFAKQLSLKDGLKDEAIIKTVDILIEHHVNYWWERLLYWNWFVEKWNIVYEQKSPIEEAFFIACYCYSLIDYDNEEECIIPQYQVITPEGKFIIDFAYYNPEKNKMLAVEIDGHKYHESTPKLAARDRKKSNALTEAGWTVYKYHTLQIEENLLSCAQQVKRFIKS